VAKKLRERFIITKLYKDERNARIGFTLLGIIIVALVFNLIYLNVLSINKTPIIINQTKSSPSVISPTLMPSPVVKIQNPIAQPENNGPKEYFLPLGSGSSSSDDWEDVVGAQAVLDFGSYQNIKEIRFEASVDVPTANQTVSVRLFNKTDQHPVWYSEVYTSGGESSYLVSTPIIWDKGAKTYQVQMKTQLKFQANLTQSRLHIILN
jgi:hypothetical protein